MTFLSIFVVLVGVAAALLLRYVSRRERDALHEWRDGEMKALRTISVISGDARHSLLGQEVKTMNRIEERRSPDGVLSGLTVTRILRNNAGEYFYWLWRSDESPFVKHIPHANAKLLLKKKYIAPENHFTELKQQTHE
jgi:hypothetical protein